MSDDSDLEDLLSHKEGVGKQRQDHLEQTPLNLDHLTKGQLDVPSSSSRAPHTLLTSYASAWLSYMCYAHPRCCTCLSLAAVALTMIVLANVIVNPTETFGVIGTDYSNIQSEYDLTTGKIDHWCLKGDNNSCRCEDPLEPTSRGEFKGWVAAHHANKKCVEPYLDSDHLDVAFLGESLIEEMDGRWLGRPQTEDLKPVAKSFNQHFKTQNSGIEGVALGIAGDTSPNVLWRILHGEMPPELNPRVWWLSLGMNDLGRMQCSEEVVVLGTLRVVEEIMSRKPDAHIVINSMLPMADLRGGIFPEMMDFRDAFRPVKGRPMVVNPGAIAQDPALKGVPPELRYQRPESTTVAMEYRAKKKGGAGFPGKEKMPKKGPPGDRRHLLSKEEKRAQRKKEKEEEAEEGDISKKQQPKTKGERKKEKKYLKTIAHDPVNPRIDFAKKKIKARDPTKIFVKPTKLPLWTSIHAINDELRKFADKHDKVTFFDATAIFAERVEGSKYVLLTDRISIRGHPTQLGFSLWHAAMGDKLKKMLEKDDVALAEEVKEVENAKDKKEKGGEERSPDEDAQQGEPKDNDKEDEDKQGGDD